MSNVTYFNLPHLHFGAAVGGDIPIRISPRVLGLSYGIVFMILPFVVLTQYRRATDRQTDRHSDTQTMTANTAQA